MRLLDKRPTSLVLVFRKEHPKCLKLRLRLNFVKRILFKITQVVGETWDLRVFIEFISQMNHLRPYGHCTACPPLQIVSKWWGVSTAKR